MKIKLLTLSITLILFNTSFAQNKEKYDEYVKEASSLYDAKDYKKSAETFKLAFDQLDGKAMWVDRYNAACSYALSNDAENAFYHLNYLAEHPKVKYKNLDHIKTDTDLKVLHTDERWDKLISMVEANKVAYEKDLDKPLMAELDAILELDQKYRKQRKEVEEKYGRDSDEMKAHWDLINETDSINLIKVRKILDERGWLGSKIVGDEGNSTLFLVIQHADLETQVKYLPMMQEAVKLGNARGSSLALLEDRVALGQGERQIYGSQIGTDDETGKQYVFPLIEPEKVNERRAEVGLGPLEDYISNWDIVWNVEEHKKRTEKIESEKEE